MSRDLRQIVEIFSSDYKHSRDFLSHKDWFSMGYCFQKRQIRVTNRTKLWSIWQLRRNFSGYLQDTSRLPKFTEWDICLA